MYLNLQRYADAIADFDKALSIDSRFFYAYLNKGRALVGLQQYEAAMEAFKKGEAINNSLTFYLADKQIAEKALQQK